MKTWYRPAWCVLFLAGCSVSDGPGDVARRTDAADAVVGDVPSDLNTPAASDAAPADAAQDVPVAPPDVPDDVRADAGAPDVPRADASDVIIERCTPEVCNGLDDNCDGR